MIIYKDIKGKRISDTNGFIKAYAFDPDRPDLDNHVFLMYNICLENGLLGSQFRSQYGDLFVKEYVKHIDFKPYKIYVFKRDLDIVNIVLTLQDIERNLPLEDDDSLYLPDDYSFTIKK